jgi:hypothetical protein|tara:strand:+ start:63 stop:446 length:384 start_codon:yes stop_codon:yes gene_type:complete
MNEIEKLQKLAGIVNEKDAGSVEKLAVGHVDNERDMIRRNLYQIGKYSMELFKMLGELPDSDFPHWWQAKVVKSKGYLSDAKHYLENSLEVPALPDTAGPQEVEVDGMSDKEFDDEMQKDQDPSGVS